MEGFRTKSFGQRVYEDFQPSTSWISNTSMETLLIHLPGFSKEQLKLLMDNQGNIRATGERPLDAGRRWSRFQSEHPIPRNTDVKGIRARFDTNNLYITFPKIIVEEPISELTPETVSEPEKKLTPATVFETEKKQTPATVSEPEKKPEKEEDDDDDKKGGEGKDERDDDYEKKVKGGVSSTLSEKMGNGFLVGMRRRKQVAINMVVAVIVIVGIVMYVTYKLRGGSGETKSEVKLNAEM